MKKLLIFSIFLFIISLAVGYFFSIYIKKDKEKNKETAETEYINDVEETSNNADEIKLAYNARCFIKKYYSVCGHENIKEIELPKEMVNKTKNELSLNYPEWKITDFSSDSITLSENIKNVCDEHYLVKLDDNIVDVYKMNENKEYNLYKDTNITSDYLAETDVKLLEDGIYVYGTTKLNSVIEDFE